MGKLLTTLVTVFGVNNLAMANGTDPFAALLVEVNNRSVFNQITSSESCPKAIGLVETTGRFETIEKQGDRTIYLASHGPGRSTFTFEGNTIFYRPNLS